jgi:hypothetical protein
MPCGDAWGWRYVPQTSRLEELPDDDFAVGGDIAEAPTKSEQGLNPRARSPGER